MNRILPRLLIASIALLLAACASQKGASTTLFDLGPAAPRSATIDAPMSAVVVSEATGSAALESERMFYRLNYADAMQARAYANSRWSTNPLEMVTQRVKTRLAQTGVKVLQPTDSSTGVPILRVEVDDFTHAFDSASQSRGQVVVRASLFRDHVLLDQQTFSRSTPAPAANASGGANALAASTDAVADDIAAWLARVNHATR
ncbi:PqiC family protein [Massilia solisilvae]|uniref:PqiC family protein n=1 Tax=Massilia solisilvae TaxID=1811225 RepID=A0ABT2BR91_9BURK|nr:PqiC family protein [Massilia solisilvae]MCS0610383.1 PqiC family protein [Massilia solisilvae]